MGFSVKQILATAAMLFVLFILGSALLNIPNWMRDAGMPIYPAIPLGQATLLGIALITYGLHQVLISPILASRRLKEALIGEHSRPWELNKQWKRGKVTHTNFGKALFLWLFTLNWWGVIVFFVVDSRDQLSTQSIAIYILCAIILIIGFIITRAAMTTTLDWFLYGTSQVGAGHTSEATLKLISIKNQTSLSR